MRVNCPICRAPVSWEANRHRPFCSERCRLVDLGAWNEGRYRIAGERVDKGAREEDDDPEDPS